MKVFQTSDSVMNAVQTGARLVGNVVHSEYLGGRWRHVVEVTAEISLNVLTAQRAPATRVWAHFPIDRCLLLPETA